MAVAHPTTELRSQTDVSPIETLTIKNFAGLEDVSLEFAEINILIGPQTSGKSICVKLLYFFRDLLVVLPSEVGASHTQNQILQTHSNIFVSYFPVICWSSDFVIKYSVGSFAIEISPDTSNVGELIWSVDSKFATFISNGNELYLRTLEQDGDRPDYQNAISAVYSLMLETFKVHNALASYFVPAGRSFFVQLAERIFTLLSSDTELDPFMVEYGRRLEYALQLIKRTTQPVDGWEPELNQRIAKLLYGGIERTEHDVFIVSSDGRRTPIQISSSGQQEVYPLATILSALPRSPRKPGSFIIEEPEAHLFPTSQKEMVELLVFIHNMTQSQLVLTTHSPYILSSINNLLYAGKLALNETRTRTVKSVVGDNMIYESSRVRAYYLADGKARSIMSDETGLILADQIDDVSEVVGTEFDKLMDIEFSGE